MYLLLKGIISGGMIVGISELAKRYSLLAALLASLPLTSLLAFVWMYLEKQENKAIAALSIDIIWLVIPSLAFFMVLAVLLERGVNFWLSILAGSVITALCYAATLAVKQWVVTA